MHVQIENDGEASFTWIITLDGRSHTLRQSGGEWRVDGLWIASRRIDWPEAIGRALRQLTGGGFSNRIGEAIAKHPLAKHPIVEDHRTRVWHSATQRYGRVVCATSNHADGSFRVIVEWEDGTEGPVREIELIAHK